MIVELRDGLRPLPLIPASCAIIMDDFGNPLVVVARTGASEHVITSITDGEAFQRTLRQLGLDRTVSVQTLQSQRPSIQLG